MKLFSLFCASCASLFLIGCGADNSSGLAQDQPVQIGSATVLEASLTGDIGEVEGIALDAPRVTGNAGAGGFVELAGVVEGGRAVMHLLELRTNLLDLELGTTEVYTSPNSDASSPIRPRACVGRAMDEWNLDLLVEELEVSVEPGEAEGTRRVDWTLRTRPVGESEQRSNGTLIIEEPL